MTELMSLDIKFGELRTIELGAFNGATKLRELLMQGNKIIDILPGTFKNMSSLEYLDLSYNKIKHLNSAVFSGHGTFSGLTKLTHLSMRRNKISEILTRTFENMSNLEYLDLSYNKIKHLDSDVFRCLESLNGLTKLTRLSMQGNKIIDILPGTFKNMSSLEYLDLSYNRIKHLGSGLMNGLRAFKGLTKMTRLLIVRNKISEIMPGTFENMSSLEYLDLSYNRIKDLECCVQWVGSVQRVYKVDKTLHG
jgi:carboxypeptidase N regulatory subunit